MTALKTEIQDRTRRLAIDTCLYCRNLPKHEDVFVVRRQLIRSITSVSANYRAACRAKSQADFINKLKIVEEELDESLFWLDFIKDITNDSTTRPLTLAKETHKLLGLIVNSLKTLRSRNTRSSIP